MRSKADRRETRIFDSTGVGGLDSIRLSPLTLVDSRPRFYWTFGGVQTLLLNQEAPSDLLGESILRASPRSDACYHTAL